MVSAQFLRRSSLPNYDATNAPHTPCESSRRVNNRRSEAMPIFRNDHIAEFSTCSAYLPPEISAETGRRRSVFVSAWSASNH